MRFLLIYLLFFSTAVHAKVLNIIPLKTTSGVQAWLVEDHSQPLLAMQISFKGGAAADPATQTGLSHLAASLFDEGAGTRNSNQFQSALTNYAIEWQFSASPDYITGQFKVASQYLPLLAELLKDALTKPHLAPDAITRMKSQILAQQKFQHMDASYNAKISLMQQLFGNHPYGKAITGTPQTINNITQADLQKFWQTRLARQNLQIALVGNINPKNATKLIDNIFKTLPAKSLTKLPPPIKPNFGAQITQKWPGKQATIMLAQAGPARQSTDWWALRLVDYVLGGGAFESRLMTELREKNGLTYGISTSLNPLQAAPLWLGQAAVAPEKTPKAKAMILAEWQKLKDNGLTAAELADAKTQLIGNLSLALSSTDDVASILLQMQRDNLPLNALDTRSQSINKVSLAQANDAAKKWLAPKKLTIFTLSP
jgi:zinc protease